jgi:hypothetical protein
LSLRPSFLIYMGLLDITQDPPALTHGTLAVLRLSTLDS